MPDSWEEEDMSAGKYQDGAASDQGQDSERSSESWQQVPDSMVDDNDDQVEMVEPSRDKGKARALDESPHGSPEDRIWTPPELEDDLLDPTVASEEAPGSTTSSRSVPDLDSSYRAPGTEDQQQPDDVEIEPEREPIRQNARPPLPLVDRCLDWVFGDIAPGIQAAEDNANDEHIVRDVAHEAPFVPFAANEPREAANQPNQDPEVAAAAAQAGINLDDQDAIDDAEDLEGILELIGMQGPLTGLFQNAMFSAVLISATLACAVWFPYLWGKVVLLLVGSPISFLVKIPLQIIATIADLLMVLFTLVPGHYSPECRHFVC